MKLNYEVEWDLRDEVIDNIVDEVEETVKQYPNYDVNDYLYEFVSNFLNDLDADDCDQFNRDCYLHEVAEEVKKRYFDRKEKSTALLATPTKELHSGYIQSMDGFGRIWIPKELRCLLDLKDDDHFEIFFDTEKNIVLKKYHG